MALQAGKRLATSPLLRLAAATAPRAAVAAAAAPSAAWHSDALVRVSSRSGRQVREVSSSSHRAAADKGKRPLSPHLTIYRFGQNALTSIGFRATGMVLTGGTALGALGMLVASHPAAYYVEAMREIPGLLPLVKFGVAAPLTYHYIGGLRHLGWDNLVGHDMATANMTGLVMVGATGVIGLGLAFY